MTSDFTTGAAWEDPKPFRTPEDPEPTQSPRAQTAALWLQWRLFRIGTEILFHKKEEAAVGGLEGARGSLSRQLARSLSHFFTVFEHRRHSFPLLPVESDREFEK